MRISYFAAINSGAIDTTSGVISGVSVITEGEAKGHDLLIDKKTLSQIKTVAASHKTGVKVKMNHGTGVDAIVGTLRNFRVDGNQVRADLHLLKSSADFAKVLEMAQTMPESFGLSIHFSGEHEGKGANRLARCSELYSVDLVDDPAANPTGLFSEPKENKLMTKETIDFYRLLYKLDAALTDDQVLAAMKEKAQAAQKALETPKPEPTPAPIKTLSAEDVKGILADALKPVTTELEALKTKSAEALKAAEKAERDALVAEASRDGKEIPLSAEEIAEMPAKTLRSMISKLAKKAVPTSPRAMKPLDDEEKKQLQGSFNRAADKLTNLFNSVRN